MKWGQRSGRCRKRAQMWLASRQSWQAFRQELRGRQWHEWRNIGNPCMKTCDRRMQIHPQKCLDKAAEVEVSADSNYAPCGDNSQTGL